MYISCRVSLDLLRLIKLKMDNIRLRRRVLIKSEFVFTIFKGKESNAGLGSFLKYSILWKNFLTFSRKEKK